MHKTKWYRKSKLKPFCKGTVGLIRGWDRQSTIVNVVHSDGKRITVIVESPYFAEAACILR